MGSWGGLLHGIILRKVLFCSSISSSWIGKSCKYLACRNVSFSHTWVNCIYSSSMSPRWMEKMVFISQNTDMRNHVCFMRYWFPTKKYHVSYISFSKGDNRWLNLRIIQDSPTHITYIIIWKMPSCRFFHNISDGTHTMCDTWSITVFCSQIIKTIGKLRDTHIKLFLIKKWIINP